MQLTGHDLCQLNEERLHQLREENLDQLEKISVRLLSDLKDALERLYQSPSNSSRPPSRREPWSKNTKPSGSEDHKPTEKQPASEEKPDDKSVGSDGGQTTKGNRSPKKDSDSRKPGKQYGAPGFARMQTIPITETIHHYPQQCVLCGNTLNREHAQALRSNS